MHNDKSAAKLSFVLTEISQAGAGIYKSLEGAGDLAEDKPHWVINTCLSYFSGKLHRSIYWCAELKEATLLFPLVKNGPFCALAAAGSQSSLWCPDIPHCSNLPSSAAPLHRAGPHNAQMVAIVLPRPLPHSVEQEALLCMPEGQEAWLTNAEPSEKHKNTHTQGYFYVYTFLTF